MLLYQLTLGMATNCIGTGRRNQDNIKFSSNIPYEISLENNLRTIFPQQFMEHNLKKN